MSINGFLGRINALRLSVPINRCFTTTTTNRIKEIRETTDGSVTVIEGVTKESPRKDYLVQPTNLRKCCCLCYHNLDLQHTDVLILSQFTRSDGVVLPRHITGLCGVQHHLVTHLVSQAQKAGLMKVDTPISSTPMRRDAFSDFNRYFDPGPNNNKTRRYV